MVLQHLTDLKVKKLAKEISRLTKQNAILLLCEQIGPHKMLGDTNDETWLLQYGRTIEEYKTLSKDFSLIKTIKSVIKPTYRRLNTGSYLLFQKL